MDTLSEQSQFFLWCGQLQTSALLILMWNLKHSDFSLDPDKVELLM